MQWQLWDILQENSLENIQPNPPSSGMLGKIIALKTSGSVRRQELSKMSFFKDIYKFMVLIRVVFPVFFLCQNVSFLSSEQQLSCIKLSALQHPSETAVPNMAQFQVETGEQTATLGGSLGFVAPSARAVPTGCKRKDVSPAGSNLVRQINLITVNEF